MAMYRRRASNSLSRVYLSILEEMARTELKRKSLQKQLSEILIVIS